MRKVTFAGLVLVGACSFGADGDFSVTEVGLVSVESLWFDEVAGPVVVSSASRDELEFVVAFDGGGAPGELRIRDLQTMLDHGGLGTLRTLGVDGWSEARTVRLTVTSSELAASHGAGVVVVEITPVTTKALEADGPTTPPGGGDVRDDDVREPQTDGPDGTLVLFIVEEELC